MKRAAVFRTGCGVTVRRVGREYELVSPCCSARVARRRCSACQMGLPVDGRRVAASGLESLIRSASAAYGRTCPQPVLCADAVESVLIEREMSQ